MKHLKWVQRKAKKSLTGLNSNDYLEKLGRIRGIKDLNEFLNPDANSLNDASKMLNVNIANQKVLDAIYEGKRICVSIDSKL